MSQSPPGKSPVLCDMIANPCSGLEWVQRKVMCTALMTANLLMAHVYGIFEIMKTSLQVFLYYFCPRNSRTTLSYNGLEKKKKIPPQWNFGRNSSDFDFFRLPKTTVLVLPCFLFVRTFLLSTILCVVILAEMQFRAQQARESCFLLIARYICF